MRSSEIRSTFLDFFRERDHRVVPSSPLIPPGAIRTAGSMLTWRAVAATAAQ